MTTSLEVTATGAHGMIVVLTAVGELNMRTSAGLGGAVDAALEAAGDRHRHVVLDLSGVPFCDSGGLNALIVLYRRLHEAGGSLTLAAVPERTARLLDMTGVRRLIATYKTVGEATAHHPHAGAV